MKDSVNVERHFRGMGPGGMNGGMREHWRQFGGGMGGMHHFHHGGHFPVVIFMAELLLITIVICFTVWKMNKDKLRAEKEARG